MHDFLYKKGELYAEDIPVRQISEKVGTPLYIYSHKTLLRHFNAFKKAFNGFPHLICFALKANSSGAILRLFAKQGGGADIVSGGELFRAIRAGIQPKRIVYAGVGKAEDEIRYALKTGILVFNVESSDELKAIDKFAGQMGVKAPIALRINPDIDPETHPYISTGLRKHKFGIPIEEALEYYRLARQLPNTKILGVHKHIGSQITKVSPFVDALKKVLLLVEGLKLQGMEIKYLNIGGGLGIPYNDEEPPKPEDLARALLPLLKGKGFTLILEPGRSIAGNAGILVTKVLYIKKGIEKEFIIVDAGMNDFARPSLYGAFHKILPVTKRRRQKVFADVVGPICESSDFLARDREIERPSQGEILALIGAGAYGFSMSSNYNSRPRIAEVMVKGKEFFVVRDREDYKDLVRGERIPEFLK